MLPRVTMQNGFARNKFSLLTLERPSLDQFVLLSLMLHVLVIVLFGDSNGGGARRGEKLWGALTVTVQGLLPISGVGLKLDRDITPRTRADAAPPPAPALREPSQKREEIAPASASAIPSPEQTVVPVPSPPIELPPLISKDVEKPETEFVVPKPLIEQPTARPATQAPREVTTVPAPTLAIPVVAVPAPESTAPPKTEPAIVSPLPSSKTIEPNPAAEPVTIPATAPPPLPPKIERDIAKPALPSPAATPTPREVVPPTVQPVAPAPIKPELESVQPVALPTEPKPREIPVAMPPALRADTPTAKREVATPAAPPSAVVAPAPTQVGTPVAKPSGNANTDGDLSKQRNDARTPGLESPGLPTPPAIDLDAVRRRARELSGGGPRTVFPFPTAPQPKPKSKVEQAFDKALKKNDCREAYADLGLAAVVPLVLDAVREGGCKW